MCPVFRQRPRACNMRGRHQALVMRFDCVWKGRTFVFGSFASVSTQRFDCYFSSNCEFRVLEVVSERDSQDSLPREPLSLRGSSGLLFLSSALWRRRLGTSRGFGMEPEVTFRALCGAGGSVDEMHLGSEFEAFEGVNGLGHGSDSVVSQQESRQESYCCTCFRCFLGPQCEPRWAAAEVMVSAMVPLGQHGVPS